jgi:hypothetical protein
VAAGELVKDTLTTNVYEKHEEARRSANFLNGSPHE